ncbi:MAG: phosphoribosylamine--glycine ligase [Acetobacteraceae bacterium]|nr:phosphoribosylamine--glycine ligase [Acetobacteraceae bacterium]
MGLKVLLVGGGGREHALAWKLAQSPLLGQLYCAPGNAGIAEVAECVPLGAEDVGGLLAFARRAGIDLTVVGPEAPLVLGLADAFRQAGLKVFGPSKRAAQIEGSKALAKEIMAGSGIPTARFRVCGTPAQAREAARELGPPVVVKADGLAAGKGVVVAATLEEADRAISQAMEEAAFGASGLKVVVEERLSGAEASLLAITDGRRALPLLPARDYKRALDGDRGPNTGGMGSICPLPEGGPPLDMLSGLILLPTLNALAGRGCPFCGLLYAGLMLTAEGPKVLEFNARFGDPETQAILPLLESDLLEVLAAAVQGCLEGVGLRWSPGFAVCVVLASGGYPGPYKTGFEVSGLDRARASPGALVFHAGTARGPGGGVVTSGGRVLGVTALGATPAQARERAYAAAACIEFGGLQRRNDIGGEGMPL